MSTENLDRKYLLLAIELARKCDVSQTAFCVGCVFVKEDRILSTGYSRENDPKGHAEEIAIEKLRQQGHQESLIGATCYCTLEPCAERASRSITCVQHIIDSKINRVVYIHDEPKRYVSEPDGARSLQEAGIKVVKFKDPDIAAMIGYD